MVAAIQASRVQASRVRVGDTGAPRPGNKTIRLENGPTITSSGIKVSAKNETTRSGVGVAITLSGKVQASAGQVGLVQIDQLKRNGRMYSNIQAQPKNGDSASKVAKALAAAVMATGGQNVFSANVVRLTSTEFVVHISPVSGLVSR